MKKVLCLFLISVFIIMSFQIPVSAETVSNFSAKKEYRQGQFTDIKGTEWYAPNIQKCYEMGLMQGKKENFFDVNGKVTLAETIATAVRAHNIYFGGDGNIPSQGTTWYDGSVAYAIANGIIKNGDFSNYNLNATRGQVAYIYANILPKSEFIRLNFIDYLPDVYYDTPYVQSILFLYEAGILSGSDEIGTFHGDSYITRAEAASLIIRVVSPKDRITFAPDSQIFLGNVPITDPYTKFIYFTDDGNGSAPVLDYNELKIINMQNPYDNGSNIPSEIVSKSEGVKVILNMALDETEKSNLMKRQLGTYKNAAWVAYAEENGLIDIGAITSANEATPINLEETINCLIATLKKFAPEVDFSLWGKVTMDGFTEYSDTTRYNAFFAYMSNIIDRGIDFYQIDLHEQITKGKMDIILTEAVNNLNIINGKKSQIKTTDLPKNADAYPYIIAGIENEVYEMPFLGRFSLYEGTPYGCYNAAKYMYQRIDQMVTEAYTEIVNIDYETISEDSFSNVRGWSLDYNRGMPEELDNHIENYIDYVKKNKIKITGKVTPLLPIVYADGYNNRVRTKIEYTIVSSDTKVDLLLCDRICNSGSLLMTYSPTIYKSQKKTIYVDIPLEIGLVNVSGNLQKVFYFGNYYPLSKQMAGKFAVKTVEL